MPQAFQYWNRSSTRRAGGAELRNSWGRSPKVQRNVGCATIVPDAGLSGKKLLIQPQNLEGFQLRLAT
jgi:hypothetical protein